jgi:hypothetical protein
MLHKGKLSLISNEHQNHIIQYNEELWDRGIPVSSQILAIELLRVDPQLISVDVIAIKVQHTGGEVDSIPAGYTPYLQVLDKGIHRIFKHFYQQNMLS